MGRLPKNFQPTPSNNKTLPKWEMLRRDKDSRQQTLISWQKNSAFLRPEIVETKFGELKEKYPSGEMKPEDFRDVFQLAFPECHHAALIKLSEFLTNKDGTIPMSSMLMLLYLLCDGQTDDNLAHIFNLFDGDGNGTIEVKELLNVMTFFLQVDEISGKEKGHEADTAGMIAEVFAIGDRNHDDKLTQQEFLAGMMGHDRMKEILKKKTIESVLECFK